MLYITDFGAVGDGKTMNTAMIAAAIRAALEQKETLCVPEGVFMTGTIDLCGVSLLLQEGAVLKASSDLHDYPPQAYVHNEMGRIRAMIVCMNAEHVSITGSGTIDLSGTSFYDTATMNVPETLVPMTPEQVAECTYPIGQRPGQGIFFHGCSDIRIEGIRITDSPNWTVSISECEQVVLHGLTFMCHDECGLIENVTVTNCTVHTRIRAGNWWGNGEPLLMMAVPHDRLLPAAQRMTAEKGCAIRNIKIDGLTCTGENAMGIIGQGGNIRGVTLAHVTYQRVPSANLPLKGRTFDLSPALTRMDVPDSCGLCIRDAEVTLTDADFSSSAVIRENCATY